MPLSPLSGVGLGYRAALAGDVYRAAGPERPAFLELIAEHGAGPRAHFDELVAAAEAFPVSVHGVGLSLGTPAGLDRDRVALLARVARATRARVVSEHASFVRAEGWDVGHLTALPFSRAALDVLSRNVAAVRRKLPDVPFLIENVAWAFRPAGDEMDEGTFHAELVHRTGCDLLLDVANVLANARNAGEAPEALLGRYPLARVAQIHVAGGVQKGDFYFDTHTHPLPGEVLSLLARTLEATGPVPVLLERDGRYPPWEELAAELLAIADVQGRAASRGPAAVDRPASPVRAHAPSARDEASLKRLLRDVARSLTTGADAAGLGAAALARSRDILQRKGLIPT